MKKVIISLATVAVLTFLYFYFRDSRDRRLIDKGNEIVSMIEEYKVRKKRLPNSLEELGINNENELFYNKWDSVNYMVWYGTTLGESVTYYSDSRKWEDIDRGFK
jgi:type II secretory pathway pseudopilin PulG